MGQSRRARRHGATWGAITRPAASNVTSPHLCAISPPSGPGKPRCNRVPKEPKGCNPGRLKPGTLPRSGSDLQGREQGVRLNKAIWNRGSLVCVRRYARSSEWWWVTVSGWMLLKMEFAQVPGAADVGVMEFGIVNQKVYHNNNVSRTVS